jgi:hypothetical protein
LLVAALAGAGGAAGLEAQPVINPTTSEHRYRNQREREDRIARTPMLLIVTGLLRNLLTTSYKRMQLTSA